MGGRPRGRWIVYKVCPTPHNNVFLIGMVREKGDGREAEGKMDCL